MEVNPPPRRTQAQRTAATRATLLDAARTLFSERGFAEVSTQAIVSAAGVTRGALYHQFADKVELFAAVYEQLESEIVAKVADGIAAAGPADPLAAMTVGARVFLKLCSTPEFLRIGLLDAPAVLGWDRWRAIGTKYGLGVIEVMIGQAVADGAIPDQPVRATAHVLLGALDEAALFVSRAEDREAATAQMHAVCDRLIAGLGAGSGARPGD